MKLNLHISKQEIDKQAKQIFGPARYGESGVGMCYLGCKIDYNLLAFLSRKRLMKKHLGGEFEKIFFVHHNLSKHSDWEEVVDKIKKRLGRKKINIGKKEGLTEIIEKLKIKGKRLYLLLTDIHQLEKDQQHAVVKNLHQLIEGEPSFGVMLFLEANINEGSFYDDCQEYHKFLQNVVIFPAYSRVESGFFLKTLAEEWKIKPSNLEITKIVDNCGGYLWVLREVLRIKRDQGGVDWGSMIEEQGIKMRLNHIYELLDDKEKKSLANLCFGDADKARSIDEGYFLKIGLLNKAGHRYKLSLSLLESRVRKELVVSSFVVSDKNIFYKGNKVSSWFSPSEMMVMKLLVSKRGEVVEKEEVAETIWGKDWLEKYSDWAIDKVMSRLRKVLDRNGLPKNFIVTKKGQGFIIR